MVTKRQTQQLNRLAKDYADGRLDTERYRQRRTRLLDQIVGDKPPESSTTSAIDSWLGSFVLSILGLTLLVGVMWLLR